MPQRAHLSGLLYGLAAYGMWGVGPIFWHLLDGVSAWELLGHRIVWGCASFVGLLVVQGRVAELADVARNKRDRRRMLLTATLIATNWLVFMHGVLTDRVLDVSLGYFINPVVYVVLGRVVLGEIMRPLQFVAVLIAGTGIAVTAAATGGIPWIAAVLAASFAGYGLLRKTTKVPPLAASAFETVLLLPMGLAYLIWLWVAGQSEFGHAGWGMHGLLVAVGMVTALPLLAFVNAAVRLRLTTLGFLQYLAPSMQFGVAVLIFGEPLSQTKLLAFALVWVGLAVFAADAWRSRPR